MTSAIVDAVKSLIDVYQQERRAVHVSMPKLADYDKLLSNQAEVTNERLN